MPRNRKSTSISTVRAKDMPSTRKGTPIKLVATFAVVSTGVSVLGSGIDLALMSKDPSPDAASDKRAITKSDTDALRLGNRSPPGAIMLLGRTSGGSYLTRGGVPPRLAVSRLF